MNDKIDFGITFHLFSYDNQEKKTGLYKSTTIFDIYTVSKHEQTKISNINHPENKMTCLENL